MRKLLQPQDNAPLIVFRLFFGFLLAAETFGAIATGWVKRNFIDPEFTFSHIGLQWLQPLPGLGMYAWFVIMGCLGILVMLGYRYRLSLGLFTLLWTSVYLMQKESYNNHYYLLILVCIIMLWLPANRAVSLDVKQGRTVAASQMPRWCSWILIAQISIVYLFAVVSKLYPQWLNGQYIRLLLTSRDNDIFIKGVFDQHWFHLFIAWSGILFDLLIVPLLLYKRTRTAAFLAALVFHLFNAIVLQIGIFPFFALSFVLFFYPPENIRKIFLKRWKTPDAVPVKTNAAVWYFFIPYFIVQLALPLRHHFIKGDVLWTEEGHRLSWRMMLRQKNGYAAFRIVEKETGTVTFYDLQKHLRPKQQGFVATKPDGIWQLCQHIKKEYAAQGKTVSIYVQAMVSVNGSPFRALVDPKTDMAQADWNYFGHSDWILLYND